MKKSEILQIPCSYSIYKSAPVKIVSLGDILFKFPLLSSNKAKIERCRSEAKWQITERENGNKTKSGLPLWIPGVWSGTKKTQLHGFAEVMLFDVDEKENPGLDVAEMKRRVTSLPEVAVCGLSARGLGVWGLVAVPADAKTESRFQGYFRAFSEALRAKGVIVDGSGINLNRARFLSYDRDLYLAEEFPVWSEWKAPAAEVSPRAASSPTVTYCKGDSDLARINILVSKAEAAKIDPFPTSRAWWKFGKCLAGCYGEAGRDAFLRMSEVWTRATGLPHRDDPNSKYDEILADKDKWTSPGYLFAAFRDAGVVAK